MKSMLVIGMGSFGRHLASKLASLRNEVMIVDKDEKLIEELAPNFTDAQICDCTNENALRSLGVTNFDICFVTIGENFQSSLEITSLLHEMGAKYIISKASSKIQQKFLLRNGANEAIYPEHQVAHRLAMRCSAKNIFDYVELTPEFGIFEIPIKPQWIGHDILSLNIRSKFNVNILAIKNAGNVQPLPSPEYRFKPDDHIVLLGKPNDVYKLSERI